MRSLSVAWIARNRYRWFGKKETCRLPSPEERAKFLA
jgi:predicted DCC family thiol-disulfide oxidoreductase YuxK